MLLSGVRSSCDMLARNSDLYFDVSDNFGRLFLERTPGLLNLLVLALDFDVAFGKLLRLLLQLLVGLLQLFSLRLQFSGELLQLLQQAFGLHRRLDAVEHDTNAVGELLKEGRVRDVVKRADGSQLDDGLDLVLEQHR